MMKPRNFFSGISFGTYMDLRRASGRQVTFVRFAYLEVISGHLKSHRRLQLPDLCAIDGGCYFFGVYAIRAAE